MRERGEEVYHLAFGQSPFSILECFVDALKENAHINDYLPVAGRDMRHNTESSCEIQMAMDLFLRFARIERGGGSVPPR